MYIIVIVAQCSFQKQESRNTLICCYICWTKYYQTLHINAQLDLKLEIATAGTVHCGFGVQTYSRHLNYHSFFLFNWHRDLILTGSLVIVVLVGNCIFVIGIVPVLMYDATSSCVLLSSKNRYQFYLCFFFLVKSCRAGQSKSCHRPWDLQLKISRAKCIKTASFILLVPFR